MKKGFVRLALFLAVLFAISCIGIVSYAQVGGYNTGIVSGGDFENGTLAGWTILGSSIAPITYLNADVYSGRVMVNVHRTTNGFGAYTPTYNLTIGKTYKISFYVKLKATAAASTTMFRVYPEIEPTVNSLSTTYSDVNDSNWTKVTRTYTPTKASTKFVIQLQGTTPANVTGFYLDNVCIEEVDDTAEITSINLSGSPKIRVPVSGSVTSYYIPQLFDANSKLMNSTDTLTGAIERCTYSFNANGNTNISFNTSTACLTVPSTAEAGTVSITATLVSDQTKTSTIEINLLKSDNMMDDSDFEDGMFGFYARQTPTSATGVITVDNTQGYNGSKSLKFTRAIKTEFIRTPVLSFAANTIYYVSVYVKTEDDNIFQRFRIYLDNGSGGNAFVPTATYNREVTSDGWTKISGTFKYDSNVTRSAIFQIQGTDPNPNLKPLYFDDFVIRPLTEQDGLLFYNAGKVAGTNSSTQVTPSVEVVNMQAASTNATIIAAVYDGDTLVDMQFSADSTVVTNTINKFTFTNLPYSGSAPYTYKFFVWDGLTTIKPLHTPLNGIN